MGRFVEEKHEVKQDNGFRPFGNDNKKNLKNQMASSSIFGQTDPSDFDRFPQFNLHAVKTTETTNLNSNPKKLNIE